MRYIDLEGSGGPADSNGLHDAQWIQQAEVLFQSLRDAPDKITRDLVIDNNSALWGQLRSWLLKLSYDKCWYSEARDIFSVLEVEHFRPKKRCKRAPRGEVFDGYWWLTYEWKNYRLCGKVGNAKKGDFFPLAQNSPAALFNGPSILNEIPLLLDPACPGDPDLISFDEDGSFSHHSDADEFTMLRVITTRDRLNLNQGRIKKARQRVWSRCWALIEDCRLLVRQLNQYPSTAEIVALNEKKKQLRSMVEASAEFSSVAKSCLHKSNISWAKNIAAGS